MKIGIISGHPLPDLLPNSERIIIETSYGSIPVHVSKCENHDVFYINRHGESSSLPPHKVKYLANIEAFSVSHIDCVFSVGTVGSLNREIRPGDFVIPHDFIDMTKSRPLTFFENRRVHVDMSDPFCPSLRSLLIESCKTIDGLTIHEQGVYLTTEGPRLETVSEIKLFSSVADIVGMTLVPEVVLAREKGLCFASLCVVCNMAAGLQQVLPADEIIEIYSEKEPFVSAVLTKAIQSVEKRLHCSCNSSITKASL